MKFHGEHHRSSFLALCDERAEYAPAYTAAVYLLTADKKLYARVHKCIDCDRNRINFRRISVKGITPYQHALLGAAEDLYNDTVRLNISDLSNTEVINCELFRLIMTAICIKRSARDANMTPDYAAEIATMKRRESLR